MKYRIIPSERPSGRTILSSATMRETDRRAIEDFGISGIVLMEHAGRHVARTAAELLGPRGRVIVVCGKGNNGGDGLVAARHLSDWGDSVSVYMAVEDDCLSGDASIALNSARSSGIDIRWRKHWKAEEFDNLRPSDVLVDALFGTGLSGDLRLTEGRIVEAMNRSSARIVAVDIPTGICSDSGQMRGRQAIQAEAIVTLHASQPGHWLFPGSEYCGRIDIVDIGLPQNAMPTVEAPTLLMT